MQVLHSYKKKNTKKEKIKIQYRNGAKDVLFLESKMFFLQEQIMVCARKSNIFDTFSVLNLNPNEKKNTFSKSVIIFFAGQTFRWIHDKVSIWNGRMLVWIFCYIIINVHGTNFI
jgi:hypothetical protein